ncbi:hypothetical protein COSO111634_05240 [Corallococcus soli]
MGGATAGDVFTTGAATGRAATGSTSGAGDGEATTAGSSATGRTGPGPVFTYTAWGTPEAMRRRRTSIPSSGWMERMPMEAKRSRFSSDAAAPTEPQKPQLMTWRLP